jgi:ribonuclease R
MSKNKPTRESDPFRQREEERYERPIPSREFILQALADQARPMRREAIAELLGLAGDEEQEEGLRRRLRAMERDGQLIRNRRQQYVVVDNEELVRGRVVADKGGFGTLYLDTGGDPV